MSPWRIDRGGARGEWAVPLHGDPARGGGRLASPRLGELWLPPRLEIDWLAGFIEVKIRGIGS